MMKEHDLVESEAWTDFSKSAPDRVVAACGIKVFPVGGVYATITSKINILAFNRVVGLGINEPIDDRVIDIILNIVRNFLSI